MDAGLSGLAQDAVEQVGRQVPWAPVRIVFIVVGALVVRWLILRVIHGFVRRSAAFTPHPRLASTRSGRLLLDSAGLLAERRQQRVRTLGSTLRSLASFTIVLFAGLMILDELKVNTLPAVAGASVVAAALAFGAQQIVRDFLTGAFLLVEDQYGVGDTIDIGTISGTVEAVGLRITQLRDDSGVVWYVRNGEIVRVGNRSQGWGNAVVDVPVAYDADLAQVRTMLAGIGAELRTDTEYGEDILDDAVVTGPESLAADHVVMRITMKTAPGEHVDVQRELRERIWAGLGAAGLKVAAATPAPPPGTPA